MAVAPLPPVGVFLGDGLSAWLGNPNGGDSPSMAGCTLSGVSSLLLDHGGRSHHGGGEGKI
ncbi:hypothetical protein J0895_03485 [Phormidium pseudopriestleyi FRX01]|uniref:Uncharacterized protein n=1 Tax=Phormidium pseudopriestleyi FRX01 TaxID=1759528 RepID=A0ABS3FM54_9CYAN|nr:hypothetical protein [Phormidium pseudopriestleyi]MBO0348179.1 hypothetical protein [Phormidium pseudopriestleyi FRX01]